MGTTRTSPLLLVKVLFGAIAMMSFALLLFVGTLESGSIEPTTTTTLTVRPAGIFKHQEVIGKEKLVYKPELDLNYMMSKRKVPNGPDPIHNRRAGNSKRPPGRA